MALFFIFNTALQAQLKPYEAIGEMIKQNVTSPINPTYKVPNGTVNLNAYLTSAISVGDAVSKPLSYFVTSASGNYYVNYSLTSTILERGKSFNLVLSSNKTESVSSVNAFVFADWNRDGVFETNLGKHTINNLNNDVAGVSLNVAIPADAELGKTRIRVHYTSNNLASIEPEANVSSGLIYDFVVFVTEKTEQSNLQLSVTSNNTNFGNAIIVTEASSTDGRYPSGTSIELKALKNGDANFVGWSNGTTIVSTDENYSFTLTENTYLIAIFKTLTATLEAPQISSAEKPIWYQIKNAQTDNRLNCFLAYTEQIPTGYPTKLRIEKPEDFTDKFLWRLEASENGMVKLVNKGSNKQIFPTSDALNVNVEVAETGSDFMVTPSGHSNGSYSIKYNNRNDRLLNGGIPYNVVLYNAGVGTGSGWFFYRVPLTTTSTQNIEDSSINYAIHQDILTINGLNKGDKIAVYNLLGHKVKSALANDGANSIRINEKGVHIVTISNANNYKSVKKILF